MKSLLVTKMEQAGFRLLFLLLSLSLAASAQTVAPFMGLGNAQFFDNNGKPLTAGMLYSYQAGTSTQQATFTDSTGTTLNPNPIPFGSGARVQIWLTSGAFYKFVLCLQNDGPFCAPADVLFSVDQVPGSPGGVVGPSGSPFISGSPNPATTGILRLASSDAICWRNAAGTANLCIRKDASDVLSWDGGAMKFPEIPCANAGLGFDYLCASSANHRWMMANNGGGQIQMVGAGQDINTSDFVIQWHFGATGTPLSATPPTPGQNLQWNGSQIVGVTPIVQEATLNTPVNFSSGLSQTTNYTFGNAHTLTRVVVNVTGAPIGCSTNGTFGVRDLTSATVLLSATPTTLGTITVTGSAAIPPGDVIQLGPLSSAVGCSTAITLGSLTAVYQ